MVESLLQPHGIAIDRVLSAHEIERQGDAFALKLRPNSFDGLTQKDMQVELADIERQFAIADADLIHPGVD